VKIVPHKPLDNLYRLKSNMVYRLWDTAKHRMPSPIFAQALVQHQKKSLTKTERG